MPFFLFKSFITQIYKFIFCKFYTFFGCDDMVELSIVIPTYNEEKYLPHLLKAIKRQTFKDYEIIVSDNHSKDKTRVIAKQFGCKIVDGGLPGKARNNGAKVAKGKYIFFLDADVVFGPTYIEQMLKKLKEKRKKKKKEKTK